MGLVGHWRRFLEANKERSNGAIEGAHHGYVESLTEHQHAHGTVVLDAAHKRTTALIAAAQKGTQQQRGGQL